MFPNHQLRRREFGFLQALLPVLSSVIQVGGSIGSSLIGASAMKDVASTQQETTLGVAAVQERIAQLQLQAMQTQAAAQVQTAQIEAGGGGVTGTVSGVVSSMMSSNVAGIPSWILLAAGGGVVFMLMKGRRKS